MKQILAFILLVSVFAASAQVSTRCPVCPPSQGAANDSSCLKIINGAAVWLPCAGGNSQWTTSGNNIYNSNSGNVGIGTAAPSYKLDVEGSFIAEQTGTLSSNLIRQDNDAVVLQAAGVQGFRTVQISLDTTGFISVSSTDSVDISTPKLKLLINATQAAGYVLASDANGNATWQSVSAALAILPEYADDAAAAAGGVSVGGAYYNTTIHAYTKRES